MGDDSILQIVFILASLNTTIGSKRVTSIHSDFYKRIFGQKWNDYFDLIKDKLKIKIEIVNNNIILDSKISFNFFQSIPPEFFHTSPFKDWYTLFIEEFNKNSSVVMVSIKKNENGFKGDIISKFILNEESFYSVPEMNLSEAENYVKYPDKESIFGGQDRFANRISPTNSVLCVGNKIHVNNEKDALDLLVPLRHPNNELKEFIDENIVKLVQNFLNKSNNWFKDQHYTWVRNCFRQLNAEAIYSGSGGMLSRADISVIDPILAGIEAKSPTENRGSINTKAIRQAVDARVQVAHKFPERKNQFKIAIAIGRRITTLAIEEEKKWRTEGQPVLLISDLILYYLSLKTLDINFDKEDLIDIFCNNVGLLNKNSLQSTLNKIMDRKKTSETIKQKINRELEELTILIQDTFTGGVEN